MNITPFNPPQIKLMGPGPSDVYPRVLSALSRPTLGLFEYFLSTAYGAKSTLQLNIFCQPHTKNSITTNNCLVSSL